MFNKREKTIEVSGANALQPMMEVWAEEYQKIHPDIKINVNGGGAGVRYDSSSCRNS